jgi:hypothetical protein
MPDASLTELTGARSTPRCRGDRPDVHGVTRYAAAAYNLDRDEVTDLLHSVWNAQLDGPMSRAEAERQLGPDAPVIAREARRAVADIKRRLPHLAPAIEGWVQNPDYEINVPLIRLLAGIAAKIPKPVPTAAQRAERLPWRR